MDKIDTFTKLNIACGPIKENFFPEPWLNVDLKSLEADMQLDARELPAAWNDKFWEVRASHVLEHLFISEWPDVISEWVRVLKPGGVLRLALPDLKIILQALQSKENTDMKGREVLSLTKPTAALTQLYGVGYDKEDTDKRWRHRIVTDASTLITFLKNSGYFNHVSQIPKAIDSAALHGINDDSQNSWSMSIIARKKQKSLLLPAYVQDEYIVEPIQKAPSNKKVTAVFALITNENGQLLTIKNDRGWDIPGGHVEPGEALKDALKREVLEEAYAEISEPTPLLLTTTRPDSKVQYSMLFYHATVKNLHSFKNEAETTQREFLTPHELIELYGGGKPGLMIQALGILQDSL